MRWNPWKVYGGWNVTYVPIPGKETKGICESCQKPCGHNFQSFPGPGARETERKVDYTVSDGERVIVQGIASASVAQLIGSAPALANTLQAIVDRGSMYRVPDDEEGYLICAFCEAVPDAYPGQEEFVPHAVTCEWRRALETLEQLKEQPYVWGDEDPHDVRGGRSWT